MKNIAVFASGSGSNAENLIRYFNLSQVQKSIRVGLVLTNRSDALVLERAARLKVASFITHKTLFYSDPASTLKLLADNRIDYIVLAGFLWLIPPYLIEAYPNRIINIHPALLPAYGGKGMYGMQVHRAVIANGEQESGITIHIVDEQYDHGSVLFQARCRVDLGETPESLAQKIHLLEQAHFPQVVEGFIGDFLMQSSDSK
jgi:phosphoribosylglycinamide formyltransferase-1